MPRLGRLGGPSHDEKIEALLPEGEKYFGFVNDSNICYVNSVIQVLFHCKIFRDLVLSYRP